MQYSAETDLQGERLLFILQAFRDVVVEERAKAAHAGKLQASTFPTTART